MELPIVCSLSENELQQRRREILDTMRADATEMISLPNGYAFRFEPNGEILLRLARLVDLERQCCQFLSFRIVVEPRSPITLEVTGPSESLPLIREFFGTK